MERSTDITSSKPSNWNLFLLPLQPLPAPTCNNSLWVSISVTPTTINAVAETRNLGDICFFSSLLLHSTGHKIQWIPSNTTLICHFSPYSSPTSCSWTCPLLPGFPQQLQAGLPALLAPIPIPQRRLWEIFLLEVTLLKTPLQLASQQPPFTRFVRSYLSLHLTASFQTICSHSKEVLPPFLEYTLVTVSLQMPFSPA